MADDDPDDIAMFQEALNASSYPMKMVAVNDGNKLLEMIAAEMPDIVILDINMPVKGGFECIPEIRKTPELKDMPVIVLSSSDYNTHIQECLKAGANHYLIKPSTYDGLLKVIDFIYNIAAQNGKETKGE